MPPATSLNQTTMALLLIGCLLLGCARPIEVKELPPSVEKRRVQELNHAILKLDAIVDSGESKRAARIAYEYSRELAQQYEVSSSAIMHNFLVNIGVKERGLCVDWTADLLTRLQQEDFRSLDLHWGIANYENAFRLEHSSVIISARGQSLEQGLVLDPWRFSGNLFWASVAEDHDYPWKPQAEIHALKREFEQSLDENN